MRRIRVNRRVSARSFSFGTTVRYGVIGYWLVAVCLVICSSIARFLLGLRFGIATLFASLCALFILGLSYGQFFINSLVTPAIVKERSHDRFVFFPLLVRHACYGGQLFVIVRQSSRGPVVHAQQHICAMSCGPQMAGILLVIADMPGHAR